MATDAMNEQERAAYTAWLAKEIQEAIDDPRPGIPHEEVMAEMLANIAAMKAAHTAGTAA